MFRPDFNSIQDIRIVEWELITSGRGVCEVKKGAKGMPPRIFGQRLLVLATRYTRPARRMPLSTWWPPLWCSGGGAAPDAHGATHLRQAHNHRGHLLSRRPRRLTLHEDVLRVVMPREGRLLRLILQQEVHRLDLFAAWLQHAAVG